MVPAEVGPPGSAGGLGAVPGSPSSIPTRHPPHSLSQPTQRPAPLVLTSALLLSACWAASRLLLEFPQLLHRRSDKLLGRRLSLIAHRGSRAEGLPENSLAAFRDAIAAGAEVVELDVWLTASGEVLPAS